MTARTENTIPFHSFPQFWRNFLEVEIVARSAKHVLNRILPSSAQADTVASLLSHIVSTEPLDGSSASSVTTAVAASADNKGDKKKKKAAAPVPSFIPPAPNAASDKAAVLALVEAEMKRRFGYSFADLRTIRRGPLEIPAPTPTPTTPYATTPTSAPAPVPTLNVVQTESADKSGPLGSRLPRALLLRRLCQQMGEKFLASVLIPYFLQYLIKLHHLTPPGVTITARDYTFAQGGETKDIVMAHDVISLFPRTKTCEPITPLPDLIEVDTNFALI